MHLLCCVLIMSLTGSLVFLLYKGTEAITKRFLNATWHYNILQCIMLFFCIPVGKLINLLFLGTTSVPKNSNMGIMSVYGDRVNRLMSLQNNISRIILFIWIIGIASIFIRQLICYIRFRFIVSCDKVPADALLQWIAIKCAEKQGIKRRVRLYINENVNTPMLIGFFSPIILLPSNHIEHTNAEYIISHELTHYRSKDLVIKFIGLFIRTIHWFNPLVYLMLADLGKWCEYACDEKNAINLTMEMKKKYGFAILDAAAIIPIYGTNYGTPFLLPKQDLKERLTFMLNVRKMNSKAIAFAIAAAAVLLSCGFITAAASEVGGDKEMLQSNSPKVYTSDVNTTQTMVHVQLDKQTSKKFNQNWE